VAYLANIVRDKQVQKIYLGIKEEPISAIVTGSKT
jgi:hypothetical protein